MYVVMRACVCKSMPACVCVCVCGWEEGGRKSFRGCGRLVSASSSTRLP